MVWDDLNEIYANLTDTNRDPTVCQGGGGLCVWVEFCELYQEQDILVNHVGILTHEKISYLQ